jgi:formimidoylglutamate deiminase
MPRYVLQSAFLPQGWAQHVAVTVCDEGFITAIGPDPADGNVAALADVERIEGIVVPGMPNAHSHAFQRAMAGNTEYRLSARDSFWTWRQAMYALANRVEPGDLQILATQLFIEMLKSGYTSVAEFHYLHRRRNGLPYGEENALWTAIDDAACIAGIGLTFLPTLYQTSDFGGKPLKAEQARFESDTEYFLRAVERRIAAERRGAAQGRAHGQGGRLQRGRQPRRTGVAFHSLRAVPLDTLREVASRLHEIDADMPLHIHVAEQLLEVQACVRETGRRPIELLLESGLITNRWCLVHATHATAGELKGVADSGAAICVSISTEANLGDGFFDTPRYLKAGGRLCVGSDSQSSVSPAEELRWLEYQQRLRKKRRGVLAAKTESHVGTRLWRDAAQYGAQAIGQPTGSIEVGSRADWLVLDAAHASMVGAAPDTALDHLLFAGGDVAIRHVMVAGRWVVKDRRHAAEDEIGAQFGRLMRRMAESQS